MRVEKWWNEICGRGKREKPCEKPTQTLLRPPRNPYGGTETRTRDPSEISFPNVKIEPVNAVRRQPAAMEHINLARGDQEFKFLPQLSGEYHVTSIMR